MNTIRSLFFVFVMFCNPYIAEAQSTYTQVYQLLQTNCAGSGCHDGSNNLFNVTLSEPDFYNAIVNAAPQNPTALQKRNKLVIPGDVTRSFLLRKISHGISTGLVLTQPAEGEYEPNGLPKLADSEIELVRQWILFGAPLFDNPVDTALIYSYYRDGGIDDTYPQHDAPSPSEGFQIYLGKLFIPPLTEQEYFLKYDLQLDEAIEVPKIISMMPDAAHHFVAYSFLPGQDASYAEGLRGLDQSSMPSVTNGIGSGPGRLTYELPQGTAYFFDAGLIFDLNLHIRNNNPDSILATDLYVNIYTQPVGTAQAYMLIRNFLNFDITIPYDNEVHTFRLPAYDSTETKMWRIWKLYTHTHRYGIDYDAYLRNPDGTQGEQVYEGFYSYEGGFNVGYYRWGVDVTVRTFPGDALFEVNPLHGFIHEAKYKNTAGPDPVRWGDTSLEEMMVLGFQFVYGDNITSVSAPLAENRLVHLYPNPVSDEFVISFATEKTELLKRSCII